jgi:hypothetical protein
MNPPLTRTPAFEPLEAIPWYQQLRRIQIVQSLEAVQDLIVISLNPGPVRGDGAPAETHLHSPAGIVGVS